ncbi:MAG: NAD(P)H-quinone oxidoreductase [Pseudomonadota bacterium]|jgi:putative PIG3 family NAD(P)H quinone oxidoreductase
MKAVVFRSPGPAEVLTVADLPDPVPARGEVVIDVAAAGVNRSDLMERQGGFYSGPQVDTVLGLECSGTVSAVGADVNGWAIGDRVCALLNGGGYAEKVAVPAAQVLPVPKNVSLEDAAALVEVAATVWSNFQTARLQAGELLLVHGGASGISTMAIQLAKALGVRVATTAGSAEKLAFCRDLGADVLINYRKDDFTNILAAETNGHGADVILDNMGAGYLNRNVEALAVAGRIVVIGFQGGTKVDIDLRELWIKRASLFVTALRTRPAGEKAAIIAEVRENIWPLIERGDVRPIVHKMLPMSEAASAHRILEDSSHIGKVLLLAGQ